MTAFAVQLDGVAEGGQVLLRVCAAGLAVDLVQPTFAEMATHIVAEYLFYKVRQSLVGSNVEVDHQGPMLLIGGADVVECSSADPGLSCIDYPVAPGTTFNYSTSGARPLDGSTGTGSSPLSEADQQVLGHLSDLIGALTSNSQAEASILKGVLSAHRTLSQGVNAFLTGTPLPVEPNPGSGGAIVTNTDTTTGLLSSLAQNTVAMTNALGSMSGARAAQYGAATDKENEAKKGTPGTTPGPTGGGQGGTGGGPSGSGGGPSSTGGGQPGQGDGQPTSDGGGTPTSNTPSNQLLARLAGSNAPLRTWDEAVQIIEYTINGMVFTLGRFSDGTWALGRAPQPIEVVHPDGTTEIRPATIVFDIPIDKTKWDAFIAELQAQTPPANPPAEESPSTALKIFSTILDMTPLIGNVKLGIEALIGHDIITWEELSPSTRALYALCALMATPIGAKLMQGLGSGVRAALGTAERTIARGEALTAQQIANIRKVEDAIAEARAIKCAGAEVQVAGSGATVEAAESGRVIDQVVCFGPGTLVHMANGEVRVIEQVIAGESVLCAAGAAYRPVHEHCAEGKVTRVFRRRIEGDVLEMSFESAAGETACLQVTPGHPFGTERGYVAAHKLNVGDLVFGDRGHRHRVVSKSSRPYSAEVFNLEVERHHNYFVGPFGILVHNQCEAAVQTEAERAIDNGQIPGMTRETPGISEPGFSGHQPINRGRGYINDLISRAKKDLRRGRSALRAGEATEQEVDALKQAYDNLIDIRSDTTFPDIPVTVDGKTIALELKVPKYGQTLKQYFNAKYVRRGVKYGAQSFIDQMGTRIGNLPTTMESELVVDLRFAEAKFVNSSVDPAKLAQFLETEAAELRSVLSTGAYEGTNVGSVYKTFRFITGDPGTFQLSDPFPFNP